MDARPNPDPFLQVSSVVNWFSFFCPQESTVFSPLHSPKIPVKSRVTIGVLDASFHFGRFQVKNNRKWSKNNGYPESFASGRAITNKNFNKHDQNFGTWIWYWLALVSSTIASRANLFKRRRDSLNKPNILNPYWQIMENSSRNFSEIFIFRVVTQTVSQENSSRPNIILVVIY